MFLFGPVSGTGEPLSRGAAVVLTVIGLGAIYLGLTGKEFYPGRSGKKAGLQPLPRWQGGFFFCLVGAAFLTGGVPRLFGHWTADDFGGVVAYSVMVSVAMAVLVHSNRSGAQGEDESGIQTLNLSSNKPRIEK